MVSEGRETRISVTGLKYATPEKRNLIKPHEATKPVKARSLTRQQHSTAPNSAANDSTNEKGTDKRDSAPTKPQQLDDDRAAPAASKRAGNAELLGGKSRDRRPCRC
ncbi:hypothetical protein H6F78_00255 [Coleofasciculus sp. FACHB-64]|uniref:hypothetical protein n=1 Tax=Cyanophyceae TaxID=3028117 RepID=UPI00168298DE|nr:MULTISPECIES: hypothetical protein [unclassified Coleofasciculus]MBD1838017.1 hypothetical protein [Coleofasciculus sp. FACHB-501]MBD2044078.1 hypothetical protein [Coleofasciculus sp. FACHB-64]